MPFGPTEIPPGEGLAVPVWPCWVAWIGLDLEARAASRSASQAEALQCAPSGSGRPWGLMSRGRCVKKWYIRKINQVAECR